MRDYPLQYVLLGMMLANKGILERCAKIGPAALEHPDAVRLFVALENGSREQIAAWLGKHGLRVQDKASEAVIGWAQAAADAERRTSLLADAARLSTAELESLVRPKPQLAATA